MSILWLYKNCTKFVNVRTIEKIKDTKSKIDHNNGDDMHRRALIRKYLRTALVAAVATCASSSVLAQATDYPSRPVTVVVGFPPGTTTDLLTRLLSDRLTARLGKTFIVENRAGLGGSIAAAYVARATPDGYTVLMSGTGPMVISPILNKNTKYDAIKDFTPISMSFYAPYLLVAGPKLPASSFAELLAAAKANPGKVTYATTGNGTTSHLLTAMIANQTGVKMTHVPYKGNTQAMTDVVGGNVDIMLDAVVAIAPYVKSQRVKALGVTSPRRMSQYPDIPTLDELGLKGFDGGAWIGVLGPAGVPAPIVDKLNRELVSALNDPAVRAKATEFGVELLPGTPADFSEVLKKDKVKWTEAVRISGAVVD
jgi:tripartite-type tricarboxylate transporter receptor subunit TctC